MVTGYQVLNTGPVMLWPNEVARVNFTLVFDKTYGSNTPHRIPSNVTQHYDFGHPNCEYYHSE